MAKPIIAVGTICPTTTLPNLSPVPGQHKFGNDGEIYQHGGKTHVAYGLSAIFGICLDSIGNTYAVGYRPTYNDAENLSLYGTDSATTYKFNPDGYVLWSAKHGGPVYSVTVDPSGNVYTYGIGVNNAGDQRASEDARSETKITGYYTTRKYNSNGVLQWSSDHGLNQAKEFYSKIVYKNGYIYTNGGWGSNYWSQYGTITKTNATTGEVIWRSNIISGDSVCYSYGIEVDSSDNVYVCGSFTNSMRYILRKFDSSGVFVSQVQSLSTESFNFPFGYRIALNSSNELIVFVPYIIISGVSYPLMKYDLNLGYLGRDAGLGNLAINSLVVDTDNNIYFTLETPYGGSVPNNIYKLNSSFVIQWISKANDFYGYGLSAYNISVSEVETPPLKMPMRLSAPTISGDTYILSPALPIPFGLVAPVIVREYVGEPLPTLYRFYISGTPKLEVAIESFQVRANLEEQSLSVVIPMPSVSIIPTLEARLGNYLILDRGVLFRNGIEQLDTMISVVYDSIRYDAGVNNASATLSGSIVPVTGTNKTRTLAGISYRNEQNGTRRVRAAVDTYLQPGDTVNLGGGETMVVAEITITVNVDTATMEISE